MRELFLLAIHLLVTLAKLLRPGGIRAVAAESLLLKHQILIGNRARRRAPNLTTVDRVVLGLTTLFVNPRRIPKLGALIKPATLFLEIEEIKSVPYTPVLHPFVERLIGTIRREFLDRVFFWNISDLARKLAEFRDYYNAHRVHRSLDGTTPTQRAGAPPPAPAPLNQCAWRLHCQGLFQTPVAAVSVRGTARRVSRVNSGECRQIKRRASRDAAASSRCPWLWWLEAA